MQPEIIALGEPMLELNTPDECGLSEAERFFVGWGGDTSNFAVAASRMTSAFLPRDYLAGARLLHVSGISQGISDTACDTVFAAIAISRAAGRLVSYDPNFRARLWPLSRARAVIHETCRQTDLVFPSLEEAQLLTGLETPREIVAFYLGLGPKVVVLKLGTNGAMLATAEQGIQTYPPYRIVPIDTAGAGDTFDGAFVAAYLAGRSLD